MPLQSIDALHRSNNYIGAVESGLFIQCVVITLQSAK